jgi:branched-chain amino acid transport system substrate-binding protein
MKTKLVLLAAALFLGGMASASAEEVVIGAQFPLSGPLASFSGPRLKAGAELAVAHVNAAHMLGDGRTLKCLIQDNAGNKSQAIALTNRFATVDKVMAMFGVYGGTLSLPVAPVANDLKMPFLAIAGSPGIAKAGPWSFTLITTAEEEEVIAQAITERLHAKKIAIVFDRTNDSSVRIRNAVAAKVKAKGVQVVSEDGISPQDSNFGPLATRIASEPIDALFVESLPPVAANFFIQVRQAGLDPKVDLLSGTQADTPVFIKIGGKAVEGVYFPSIYSPAFPSEQNKAFVAAYEKLMHKMPDAPGAWAYASVMLLARAIHDAGPSADRDKVRAALASLHDVPSVLGLGQYSFHDRIGDFREVLVRVENGKPQIVPGQ